MSVFVLDKNGNALMPCSEKRARKLLECKRARILKIFPFTIQLLERLKHDIHFQKIELKIDPGSKTTGLALVRKEDEVISVLNLFHLEHRGQQISKKLTSRSQLRRGRRNRKTRYRAPRFLNRGNKKKGWLAPSLQHRVETTISWVKKLKRLSPVTSIAQELVRFDTQKMERPDISGVEYQQGTLAGYEIREFLLEKWGRKCAYCGAENVPLQIDHIHPRARGGSNRISNFTLACQPCNQKKGAMDIKEFLSKKQTVLHKILGQAKRPLKDVAAVNSTRWALYNTIQNQETHLPISVSSGGHTKFNRSRLSIPKTHSLDAACVGKVQKISSWKKAVLHVNCTGRGKYQRTATDKYGFPRCYSTNKKRIHGFQTGDLVIATTKKGKMPGTSLGRVVLSATGYFDVFDKNKNKKRASFKNCRLLQRADGYSYTIQPFKAVLC